jgi:hypothetical protein
MSELTDSCRFHPLSKAKEFYIYNLFSHLLPSLYRHEFKIAFVTKVEKQKISVSLLNDIVHCKFLPLVSNIKMQIGNS